MELIASTRLPPQQFIDRCREVLLAVIDAPQSPWPSIAGWASLLPSWFVDGCAAEESDEEAQRWLSWWRGLSPEDQSAASEAAPWSLADWIHWFEPGQRHWYWADAEVVDDSHAVIKADLVEWPAPVGALKWLMRAAGADDIEDR